MKYEILYTTKFKKDLKLVQKQGKNLDKLFTVIEWLSNDEKLDTKYRDHDLSGNYEGFRECHIEPDWLLIYRKNSEQIIYRKNSEQIILYLLRTGSHSDLF